MKLNNHVFKNLILIFGLLTLSCSGYAVETIEPVTKTITIIKNTVVWGATPLCIIAVICSGLGLAFMGLDKEWLMRSLVGTGICVGAGTIVALIESVSA